jgi:flagellar protein FlaG
MDKALVTILLIIAGVVCTMVIVNAVYPLITGTSGALTDAVQRIDDRIRSNIEIIEIAPNGTDVYIWVKNIGASTIGAIERSDIFFGPEGNFARIPFGSVGSPLPYWEYTLEDGSDVWKPSSTLRIIVHLQQAPSGTHFVKVVTHNGISDWRLFSM